MKRGTFFLLLFSLIGGYSASIFAGPPPILPKRGVIKKTTEAKIKREIITTGKWKDWWWRLFPVCGDGIRAGTEGCDDGNTVSGDGCSSTCLPECATRPGSVASLHCPTSCGNGVIDSGEVCDAGAANTDAPVADYSSVCRKDCQLARCGDGVVDRPMENCDSTAGCPVDTCVMTPPAPVNCAADSHPFCADSASPWTRTIDTRGTVGSTGGSTSFSNVGRSLEIDANGTLYTVSQEYVHYNPDGTPGIGVAGGEWRHETAVRQIDTCGTIIWEKRIPNTIAQSVDHIAVDGNGNSYVITARFNDILIRKYNYSGVVVWDTSYTGSISTREAYTISYFNGGTAIAVDCDGNIYATGSTRLTSENSDDVWIRKYKEEEGEPVLEWERTYNTGSGYRDYPASLILDGVGNLYILGWNDVEGLGRQSLLLKYSVDGDLRWSKTLGPLEYDALPRGLTVASDGNLYLATASEGRFLEKVSAIDGTLLGNLVLDGSDVIPHRYSRGITSDSGGNLYVVGWKWTDDPPSPVPTQAHADLLWIGKFSSDLSTSFWEDSLAGPSGGRGRPGMAPYDPTMEGDRAWVNFSSVVLDPSGNIYTIGSFINGEFVDLGRQDIIIRKYTPAGATDSWPTP
ncbi:MAG: DUF4215 domain-containing protein [Deltaproteobacteria bacterium]|nr:DUF4215 domain-containing protein [Deltaproteobacteria bacterium]